MNATDALQRGAWTATDIAALLDTPLALVERWCRIGLLTARSKGGQWIVSGRALFLFCARRVEPHYSPLTVSLLLDMAESTVRDWIKAKKLKTRKFGVAKSATVRVPESELRRWMKL